jgi:predicted amidohydrolase
MVYESGKLIGRQRKVNVTQNEGLWGLGSTQFLDAEASRLGSTPRKKFEIFKSRFGNLGVLVCADVLHAECCAELRGADIVFNPVVSKYRKKDATAVGRIAMFIARAYDNGYFILKAGGVGKTSFARIVGRSLIAAPWGIVACARNENSAENIIAELDVNLLRKVRNENEALRYFLSGQSLPDTIL